VRTVNMAVIRPPDGNSRGPIGQHAT